MFISSLTSRSSTNTKVSPICTPSGWSAGPPFARHVTTAPCDIIFSHLDQTTMQIFKFSALGYPISSQELRIKTHSYPTEPRRNIFSSGNSLWRSSVAATPYSVISPFAFYTAHNVTKFSYFNGLGRYTLRPNRKFERLQLLFVFSALKHFMK